LPSASATDRTHLYHNLPLLKLSSLYQLYSQNFLLGLESNKQHSEENLSSQSYFQLSNWSMSLDHHKQNKQTNFISQIRHNTIIADRVDMMAGCQEGRSPSMLAAQIGFAN